MEVVAILDMSGSMQNLANDTIGGFNTYINELKQHKLNVNLTLITFESNSTIVWEHKSIKDCENID